MDNAIKQALDEIEEKAWNALRKNKYLEFGHYATSWVEMSGLLKTKLSNPFKGLVRTKKKAGDTNGKA